MSTRLTDAPAQGATAWCQPMDQGKHGPRKFIVYFEDADQSPAVFDNEAEARKFFEAATTNWNCYLFGALPRDHAEGEDRIAAIFNEAQLKRANEEIAKLR